MGAEAMNFDFKMDALPTELVVLFAMYAYYLEEPASAQRERELKDHFSEV